jgi:nucleoid DNA-binding protein
MAKETKKAGGKSGALTKTAIYDELAQQAGITRKQVAAVFDALGSVIKRHLKKDNDTFKVPGLFRLRLQKKKAVKGGKSVPNPFKPGEMMVTKDKPARNVIKVSALKGLKDTLQ